MQEVEAEMAQQLTAQRSSSIKTDVFVPSNIQPGYLLFKFAAWDFFFFFFFFTQARPQSQRGELWGCLVVGLDTLGRPEVSASSCV